MTLPFNWGTFYVSQILFRHIYFQDSPVIPLGSLAHNQKFKLSHEKLFSKLAENSNLRKKKIPIIIDLEMGINSGTKLIPNLHPILCWNHICQDIKYWVQSHNGTSADILVYTNHVLQFVKSDSPDEFEKVMNCFI